MKAVLVLAAVFAVLALCLAAPTPDPAPAPKADPLLISTYGVWPISRVTTYYNSYLHHPIYPVII